jgi:hypothetical protein
MKTLPSPTGNIRIRNAARARQQVWPLWRVVAAMAISLGFTLTVLPHVLSKFTGESSGLWFWQSSAVVILALSLAGGFLHAALSTLQFVLSARSNLRKR